MVHYVGSASPTGNHYYSTGRIHWHNDGQISFTDKQTGHWILISGHFKVVKEKSK